MRKQPVLTATFDSEQNAIILQGITTTNYLYYDRTTIEHWVGHFFPHATVLTYGADFHPEIRLKIVLSESSREYAVYNGGKLEQFAEHIHQHVIRKAREVYAWNLTTTFAICFVLSIIFELLFKASNVMLLLSAISGLAGVIILSLIDLVFNPLGSPAQKVK